MTFCLMPAMMSTFGRWRNTKLPEHEPAKAWLSNGERSVRRPWELPPCLQQVEQNLKKAGQPDWHVKLLLQFNRAFNEGLASEPHPALSHLLSRPPTTFEEFARNMEFSEIGHNPFPSE